MSNQPLVIVHERSTIEWVLDGVAVAAGIGCVAIAAFNYGSLPDTIPIHFGPSGEADGWGNKAFVWLLPLVAITVVPLLIFLCGKPHKFNYLQRPTPEYAQEMYNRSRLTVRMLNAFIGGLMLLLTWEISHPGAKLLGPWLLPVALGVPLVLLVREFIPLFRKT